MHACMHGFVCFSKVSFGARSQRRSQGVRGEGTGISQDSRGSSMGTELPSPYRQG